MKQSNLTKTDMRLVAAVMEGLENLTVDAVRFHVLFKAAKDDARERLEAQIEDGVLLPEWRNLDQIVMTRERAEALESYLLRLRTDLQAHWQYLQEIGFVQPEDTEAVQ